MNANQHSLEKLPHDHSHRPVLASSFEEMTGHEEDAKYISLGWATYCNKGVPLPEKGVSVKIWRPNQADGRWGRSCEEVPVDRLPHMVNLLLAALIHAQGRHGNNYHSIAHEHILQHIPVDERDTLYDKLNGQYWPLLGESLRKMAALLKEVDLSGL